MKRKICFLDQYFPHVSQDCVMLVMVFDAACCVLTMNLDDFLQRKHRIFTGLLVQHRLGQRLHLWHMWSEVREGNML